MTALTFTIRKIGNGYLLSDGLTEVFYENAAQIGIEVGLAVDAFEASIAKRAAAASEAARAVLRTIEPAMQSRLGEIGQSQNYRAIGLYDADADAH